MCLLKICQSPSVPSPRRYSCPVAMPPTGMPMVSNSSPLYTARSPLSNSARMNSCDRFLSAGTRCLSFDASCPTAPEPAHSSRAHANTRLNHSLFSHRRFPFIRFPWMDYCGRNHQSAIRNWMASRVGSTICKLFSSGSVYLISPYSASLKWCCLPTWLFQSTPSVKKPVSR